MQIFEEWWYRNGFGWDYVLYMNECNWNDEGRRKGQGGKKQTKEKQIKMRFSWVLSERSVEELQHCTMKRWGRKHRCTSGATDWKSWSRSWWTDTLKLFFYFRNGKKKKLLDKILGLEEGKERGREKQGWEGWNKQSKSVRSKLWNEQTAQHAVGGGWKKIN